MSSEWEFVSFLCFQHCSQGINIYCFVLPQFCPVCKSDLSVAELRIPPFRLKLPLTRGKETKNSILLRPTNGEFLRNFQIGDSLHIGISNSEGRIYEYGGSGLICTNNCQEWNCCISLHFQSANLDAILESSLKSEEWISQLYNEDSYNCFDYVISILNEATIGLQWTKITFTQDLILPKINKTLRLINTFRTIERSGVFIQQNTS